MGKKPVARWFHVQKSYFANGTTASTQGFLGSGTTPFTDSYSFNTDGAGRPYGMWDNTTQGTIQWYGTNYNAASQPTQVSLIQGAEAFTYDTNSGRMKTWTSTAGSNQQAGTLTWNANGSLQKLVISDNSDAANNQTCTYGYDDLERLLSANCGAKAQTFGFDQFGNITKNGSWTFNPGYGSGNHVTGFGYDSMGNVTSDGAYGYTYDAEGRAIKIGANLQIYYDAFNRPMAENNNGAWKQFVYAPSGERFAIGTGTAGAIQNYLIPLAAGLQAVYNSSGLQYYRHSDWLGSSRFAGKTNGTVYYDAAYAPFGENYAETGTTDRSFTGQTQDTVNGLYDFLFRQYSSAQGRWLVPDPAGVDAVDITNPQTWNRYAYVGNQPLNSTDPLGLYCAIDVNSGKAIGGCTPGDPYFGGGGWGWGGIGAGGGGGSGFSVSGIGNSICGSDFLPCGLSVPSPIESIWSDVLGLPDLSCLPGTFCDPALYAQPGRSNFLTSLNNCIQNNADNYSIGGVVNLVFNVQIPFGLASNSVTDTYLTLTGQNGLLSSLWSSGQLGYKGSATLSPPIMTNGPNSLTSLAAKRGSPQPILGNGTNYGPSLGKLAKGLGELKIAADAGLSGALVLNCSLGQVR